MTFSQASGKHLEKYTLLSSPRFTTTSALPRGAGEPLVPVKTPVQDGFSDEPAIRAGLCAAADAEQQVDDEIERGGRDGHDVEAIGVEVVLHDCYRLEQEGSRGLEQLSKAVNGVCQNIGARSDASIHQRYVGEYQQDDQDQYGADETHASSSFPSRPTLFRPGWLRGVRAASIAPDFLLPMTLLRAVLSGQYSNNAATWERRRGRVRRRLSQNPWPCSPWWSSRSPGVRRPLVLRPGHPFPSPGTCALYCPRRPSRLPRSRSRSIQP